MRLKPLDQAGRQFDARAAYERLAPDYPAHANARVIAAPAQMLIDDLQAAVLLNCYEI